jgi:restriction system protein
VNDRKRKAFGRRPGTLAVPGRESYVHVGGCRIDYQRGVMARSPGPYGSYREWEAAQRAEQRAREQAARAKEQERKARERQRALEEAAARDEDAAARTDAVTQRIAQFEGLLRSSLARDPHVSLALLRRHAVVPPLGLGELAVQLRAPVWADFVPEAPQGLRRMFGGQQRYEAAVEAAGRAFRRSEADYEVREADRRRQVADARRAHARKAAEAEREAAAHNAHVGKIAAGLRDRDRYAVSEYVQIVLDRSPYPSDFPAERSAGYVPESSLLAVEWYLPSVDVIPQHKAFRHIKTRKVVEPTGRPLPEIRKAYQGVIAQIALRTLREVFDATSDELITTVVFNGRVHAIDPLTGQKIRPHLITLRATREQFARLVLDEPRFNPVECVRRYFFADISPHPDELVPVEPVMPYSMADPRAVDPVDVVSDIDKRPNLLELTPKEFEAFIQNLFAKMGFDTKLYQASGDGGIDCVAYDPHPITGGKFIIQAKLYTRTVQPAHVRDLWGTVQHEGATKGIMITTSGYGPDSYKFAGGKPLNLIDGSGLLSLCQQHEIPARILNRSQPRKRSEQPRQQSARRPA